MKQKALAAAALTLCLLTGCKGGGEAIDTSKLTGTWERTMLDGTETLTLNADMTYHKVIEIGGDIPMKTTSDDQWSVKGDTLTLKYSDFDTSSSYKVTFEGNTMTWDNGDAQIVYTKK